MLTKESIIKNFQKNPEKYWQVQLFKEKDFVRKQCPKCKKFFWTLDSERKFCADSSCEPYSFINKPITKKKLDYITMWKTFEKFFVKNNHESIKRYPVIDRTRPDLFFTIASIQDFQRLDNHNMIFVYPANPLIVPQVCLRFPDIPNIGVTGQHLTSFIMPGQHAFNYPKEGYFKDKCMQLNFEFLTKTLGIPEKELVYGEDIWSMPDYSAFGPSIETFSKGLELVNHVFMQFQKSNSSFKDLEMKVIDTGWGHERLVWFSNGTPTMYDCIFGPVTEKLKKLSGIKINPNIFSKYCNLAGSLNIDEVKNIKKAREKIANSIGISLKNLKEQIEPLQAVYAILDHTRTLLFAVTDGGIPSNVGGGYNLRVILRRALSFIDEYNFNFDMIEIADQHAKFLKPLFPELKEGIEPFKKILNIEKQKYKNNVENAKRTIFKMVEKKEKFTENKIIQLYESQGIAPEMIQEIAKIELPSDIYSKITEKHESKKIEEEKPKFNLKNLPPTELLFYKQPNKFDFSAKVLKTFNNFVVLDKTLFYPEGGGQDFDLGTINNIKVKNVQKIGNVVLHELEKPLKAKTIKASIDRNRRLQLKKHHTATHIINASTRKILGKHINQAGTHKSVEKAHLDVTHYENISDEELKKIEEEANRIIKRSIPIKVKILSRAIAEKKYGLSIYQGGFPPGKEIRIIEIPGIDVEACAGTHCDNTSEVEKIKILKASKIQDGIIRLEYVAGKKASEEENKELDLLKETAKILDVSIEQIPSRAEELFGKWKKARKAIKKGRKIKAEELELKIKKSEKLRPEELLKKTALIFKTQAEYVPKTASKFLKELKEFKKKLKER